MRAAVIGTGIMGTGMAGSLAREGHEVVVWNRTPEKARAVAESLGVTAADTVADAVDGSDVVLTVLFDTESVLAVASDIAGALGPDAVWAQCSTVGPAGVRRIAEVAGERFLDAPLLGTKKPADDGTLVMLVSGPADLVERAQPAFDAVGSRTVVAGEQIGAASGLKLACNSLIATLTAAVGQSLALAQSLGVEPDRVLAALKGGASDSPYLQLKGGAMVAGDWTTSFAVDGVRKDVGLMIEAGRSVDFPTGLLEAVLDRFEAAAEAGHGGDDMAAVRAAFPGSP